MRAHPYGAGACRIGEIVQGAPGRVIMKTCFGGQRIVDMLVGDQLPRIC
jgi:hydrogenase expression/formation protein HypE